MSYWIQTSILLPDENKIVDTKIDDQHGVRNEQQLKRVGNLWFNTDGKTYVYYTPTHWKTYNYGNNTSHNNSLG